MFFSRQKIGLIFFALFLALAHYPIIFADEIAPSSGTPGFLDSGLIELFRLRIANQKDGDISVSQDRGLTWKKLGTVLQPSEKVSPEGYTASKWVSPVHVAATAVNAIHITTDYNPETDRVVFSILPKELHIMRSYYVPSASIITSFPAGTGIFGGGWSPLVGNSVLLEKAGLLVPAEKGYVPALGDVIIIPVERFRVLPSQMVFQNRAGGYIYLQFPDGSRKVIGRVVRPVGGVGRFEGTQYAARGRIRANHAGVIDVSCSPFGVVAGFQIIPEGHAHSPEMHLALTKTQWMIVAPLSPDEHWEGVTPLFYQYIRPDYRPDDLYAPDWRDKLLSRFLVEVRQDESLWGACPAFDLNPYLKGDLPAWADTALADVTEIRILFPIYPPD